MCHDWFICLDMWHNVTQWYIQCDTYMCHDSFICLDMRHNVTHMTNASWSLMTSHIIVRHVTHMPYRDMTHYVSRHYSLYTYDVSRHDSWRVMETWLTHTFVKCVTYRDTSHVCRIETWLMASHVSIRHMRHVTHMTYWDMTHSCMSHTHDELVCHTHMTN